MTNHDSNGPFDRLTDQPSHPNDSNDTNNPHNSIDSISDYDNDNNNNFTFDSSVSLLNLPSPHCSHPRFSNQRSSPALSHIDDTISFATQNVRGINVQSKFDAILDDLINYRISVIGLQETRLTETNATFMYKSYINAKSSSEPYRPYWSYDPKDPHGGVGLIVAPSSPNTSKEYTVTTAVSLPLIFSFRLGS